MEIVVSSPSAEKILDHILASGLDVYIGGVTLKKEDGVYLKSYPMGNGGIVEFRFLSLSLALADAAFNLGVASHWKSDKSDPLQVGEITVYDIDARPPLTFPVYQSVQSADRANLVRLSKDLESLIPHLPGCKDPACDQTVCKTAQEIRAIVSATLGAEKN